MITITLTKNGFVPSVALTEELLKSSPVSNVIITVKCQVPFKGTVKELIDFAHSYVESQVGFEIISKHVVFDSSTSYTDDGQPSVTHVVTQFYW